MKYCVKYHPHFRRYQEEEMGSVIFNERSLENFQGIMDFHNQYPKLNLILKGSAAAIKEYFTVDLAFGTQGTVMIDENELTYEAEEVIDLCKERGSKFMFANPATKWDTLNYMISLGASAVIVSEELCFSMSALAKVAKKADIRLMVYCNVAQNGSKSGAVTDFYITPEDIDVYEEYIDECIIFTYGKENPATLFDIYAKDKKWGDQLGFIIKNLQESFNINNDILNKKFGEFRANCTKKCFKGGSCNYCNQIRDFSKALEDAGLKVERE